MTDKELDIAIAKHVFGANLTPTKNISVSTPAFSTTGDGMLAVIERMRERGWTPHILIGQKSTIATFLIPNAGGASDPAKDEPAPRAVAIAALKALNVEA